LIDEARVGRAVVDLDATRKRRARARPHRGSADAASSPSCSRSRSACCSSAERWDGHDDDPSKNLIWLIGGLAIGSLIGGVITANVAALRARRDHVLGLFLPFYRRGLNGRSRRPRARPRSASSCIGAIGLIAPERTTTRPQMRPFSLCSTCLCGARRCGVAVTRWIDRARGPLVVIAHVFTGDRIVLDRTDGLRHRGRLASDLFARGDRGLLGGGVPA
jgi:hypothetical protein